MLPTLVIGLREGLEAALIVGIIAAFLRKNGKSLVPMWIGVTAAVVLSVAVGVVLAAVERALPQAGQEGMESVIGVVAVVFVTGMILWMNTHARGLKRELEAGASDAIRDTHPASVNAHAATASGTVSVGANFAAPAVASVKPDAQPSNTKLTSVSGVAHSCKKRRHA